MTPTDKFVEAMRVFAGINKHSGRCLFVHDEGGCKSVTWVRQAVEAFADATTPVIWSKDGVFTTKMVDLDHRAALLKRVMEG